MISDEQLSTMPLTELRELHSKLGARIQALVSEEKSGAILKVRQLIESFGIEPKEIFSRSAGREAAGHEKRKVEPKYRDPATGKEWTGRGKPPRWLDGKNRDDYRINRS